MFLHLYQHQGKIFHWSCTFSNKYILFTDYQVTEPYNRAPNFMVPHIPTSEVDKTRANKFFYIIVIIIIIKSFHSLCSTGHPWRASRRCGLQLSPWPHSMIFLCFLSHPLLSVAKFSSAYISFYVPEDSNLMYFSLLLLFLYVMCVPTNTIFFYLSDSLLTSDRWFPIAFRS